MDPIFLVSFIISSCILKYYFSMDSKWIIKFIFGYLIGTLYIIYKNNKKDKNKETKTDETKDSSASDNKDKTNDTKKD